MRAYKLLFSSALFLAVNACFASTYETGPTKNYCAYAVSMAEKISPHWLSTGLQPASRFKIQFTVDRHGKPSEFKVLISSGSEATDRAALKILEQSGPYGELPSPDDSQNSFPPKKLKVECSFSSWAPRVHVTFHAPWLDQN